MRLRWQQRLAAYARSVRRRLVPCSPVSELSDFKNRLRPIIAKILAISCIVVALHLGAAGKAEGQDGVYRHLGFSQQDPQQLGSPGPSVAYGFELGSVGLLTGGVLAMIVSHGCTWDYSCQWITVVYGASVGWTLGMTKGIHIGNQKRGSFILDLGIAGSLLGLGFAVIDSENWPLVFSLIPLAQMVGTVIVDRVVASIRLASGPLSFSVFPGTNGDAVLVTGFAF